MHTIDGFYGPSGGNRFITPVIYQFRHQETTVSLHPVEINRFLPVNGQTAQNGPVDETLPNPFFL